MPYRPMNQYIKNSQLQRVSSNHVYSGGGERGGWEMKRESGWKLLKRDGIYRNTPLFFICP